MCRRRLTRLRGTEKKMINSQVGGPCRDQFEEQRHESEQSEGKSIQGK